MTPQEQQLVQLIAREVIAQLALRQQGSAGSQGTTTRATATERAGAVVQPPIGICTGDYSQFPELVDRLNPPRSGAGVSVTSAAPVPAAPPQSALSGFVTENQLREAIHASPQGVALLAQDARLTPLGNDFARQFPEKIKRAGQAANSSNPRGAGAASSGNVSKNDLPWHWWIQGQCPVVAQVTGERAAKLRTMSAGRSEDNLIRVIRELAQAIKSGSAAGGLLFVPSAARAMCLANRCQSIRAVVGTCGEAVEQGVRELGANVLVIEYPHHGPRSVTAMVDRIMAQPPMAPVWSSVIWQIYTVVDEQVFMRIGRVMGTLTMTSKLAELKAGQYLLVEVLDAAALQGLEDNAPRTKPMPEALVVFDQLGAGAGQLIAISEGAEATQPFRPDKVPIDAYAAAILDHIQLTIPTLGGVH